MGFLLRKKKKKKEEGEREAAAMTLAVTGAIFKLSLVLLLHDVPAPSFLSQPSASFLIATRTLACPYSFPTLLPVSYSSTSF